MNRDGRSSSQDPTGERTEDQSTGTTSGLSSGRTSDTVRNRAGEGVVDRNRSDDTPRRYEQPLEEDENPAMPGNEPTFRTEI